MDKPVPKNNALTKAAQQATGRGVFAPPRIDVRAGMIEAGKGALMRGGASGVERTAMNQSQMLGGSRALGLGGRTGNITPSGKTVYITGESMATQRQEDPAIRKWDTRLMLDRRAKAYASGRRTMGELMAEQEKGYMKINRPTMGSKIRDLFRGTVGAKIGV